MLPTNLPHLSFGYHVNQPFAVGALTDGLTHLSLGDTFTLPIWAGVLPASLTHLSFCCFFNQSLAALNHLKLGTSFNQPLTVLPFCLAHLEFGFRFNQLLAVSGCASLTHLTFIDCFIQPFAVRLLPFGLTNLAFGNSFEKGIGSGIALCRPDAPPRLSMSTFITPSQNL